MNRVDNWETAHKLVVEKHSTQPGCYGVSDCYMFADDNVFAIIGRYMFPKSRGYKTKQGAAKQLLKQGFKNVEDAFSSVFETVHPSQAQRGDIGTTEHNGEICGGVFTALGFAVRGEDKLYYFSSFDVRSAFKVGRQ